jgi:5-methylcytosine-specific restriction endonuclease McrA
MPEMGVFRPVLDRSSDEGVCDLPPNWGGDGRRGFSAADKRRIARRDGHQCAACGRDDLPLEADHVMGHRDAVAAGWTHDEWADIGNGQLLCVPCHQRKTSAEGVRGRRRKAAARKRPPEAHPGLVQR